MSTATLATKTLHRASSRGYADHGWLKTHHTFSFADYYDSERMHFGALRVLNDDTVAPGEGFGTHPHADMEIVTIPLSGSLKHLDSMGHSQVLHTGEIQVMTAGTGLTHSEYNASATELVQFLQIWIMSDSRHHTPRYEQVTLIPAHRNALRVVVAPEGCGSQHVGWIHQTAWIYTLNLTAGHVTEYRLNIHGQGAYVFVLEGQAEVAGEPLARRDGLGICGVDEFLLKGVTDTQLLIIEVPMKV